MSDRRLAISGLLCSVVAFLLFVAHPVPLPAANGYGLPAGADDGRCEALARRWFETVHRPSLPVPEDGASWDEWGRLVGGAGRVRAFGGIDGFVNSGAWWLRRSSACLAWVRAQLEKDLPPAAVQGAGEPEREGGRGAEETAAGGEREGKGRDGRSSPSSGGEGEGLVATSRDLGDGTEQVEAGPETSVAGGAAPAMDALGVLTAPDGERPDGAGSPADGVAFDTSGPQKWVFLGDSLTVGMIGDGRGFQDDVREAFGVTVTAVNTSRVGKHVTEYVREIDEILRRHGDAKYFPFLIGANDVREYSESRAGWLREKLVTVLEKIKAAGRHPILLRASYHVIGGKDPFATWNEKVYDPLIRTYSAPWYDAGAGRGAPDLHAFLKDHRDYLAPDGCHMTMRGYREARRKVLVEVMAGRVYRR